MSLSNSNYLTCFFLECAGTVSRIGNGYCDDENNNRECDYDGDDCCGELVNTEHCTFCECHLNHGMYTKEQNEISLFHFSKQKGYFDQLKIFIRIFQLLCSNYYQVRSQV